VRACRRSVEFVHAAIDLSRRHARSDGQFARAVPPEAGMTVNGRTD
jgi:hypothetical protein